MRGFRAQLKAESIRIARSPFFMLFSMVMPISFYALFTMLNGADTEVGGVRWAEYSLMSMTAFSLIGTAAGQFGIRLSHERKNGLHKLIRLTPLSTGAWVMAKLVSHLFIHAAIIVVMFAFSAGVFGAEQGLARRGVARDADHVIDVEAADDDDHSRAPRRRRRNSSRDASTTTSTFGVRPSIPKWSTMDCPRHNPSLVSISTR